MKYLVFLILPFLISAAYVNPSDVSKSFKKQSDCESFFGSTCYRDDAPEVAAAIAAADSTSAANTNISLKLSKVFERESWSTAKGYSGLTQAEKDWIDAKLDALDAEIAGM